MDKIKIGIVGCGDIAFRSYLPAIRQMADQVELVAVCDVDPERAAAAQREYGAEHSSAHIEEMLGRSDLDGVMILTSMVPHGPLSITALEAGKHVYVEKVMAVNLVEAERMVKLAEARGLVLACAPSTILLSAYQQIKEYVQAEEIGPVSLVQALAAHFGPARWDGYTTDPTWFYQPGAGPLFDLAVYPVQVLVHLFGAVKRVTAFSGLAVPELAATGENVRGKTIKVLTDDTIPIILDFGGARFATVNVSYNVLSSRFPGMQFWGSQGAMSAPQFLGDEVGLWHRGDKEWSITKLPPTMYDRLGVAAGLPHWLECIREGKQPINSGRHARHVLDILLSSQQSAKTGQAVAISSEC